MESRVREEEIEDVQILYCNVNLTSPPCKRQEARAHETIGIHEIIVDGVVEFCLSWAPRKVIEPPPFSNPASPNSNVSLSFSRLPLLSAIEDHKPCHMFHQLISAVRLKRGRGTGKDTHRSSWNYQERKYCKIF